MKKLLALVLALVMTLSLCTVSNAAFTDAEDVNYDEAVGVMSMVGVLKGYEDGSFQPAKTVTRAEAAKIITYLAIGEKAAEALTKDVTAFSDVAVGNWAAGYITYCYNEGIIAGVGDGKFAPNAQVTAMQFAKMLLGVLGYDAEREGMTGNDWALATAKLAAKNKLFEGYDAVVSSAAATREEAALYAFNALLANTVTYATGAVSVEGNGMKVTVGGSAATPGAQLKASLPYALNKTARDDSEGKFDRPGYSWTYNGKSVKVLETPVVTFTAYTKAADVAKALNGYKTTDGKKINNTDKYATVTIGDGSITATGTTTTIAAAISAITENGKLVEIYADDETMKVNDVVQVTYTTAECTKVTTDKKTGDVTYKINNIDMVDYADEDATDTISFATAPVKGDIVTYAQDGATYYVYATTSFDGTQTATKTTTVNAANCYTLTIDGKAYTVGKYATGAFNNSKSAATYYVDQYGFVVKTTAKSTASTEYAYVMALEAKLNTSFTKVTPTLKARVALADGTIAVYDVKLTKVDDTNNYYIEGLGDSANLIYDGTTATDTASKIETLALADFNNKMAGYTVEDGVITFEKLTALPATGTATAENTVYADSLGTDYVKNTKANYTVNTDKKVLVSADTKFVAVDTANNKTKVYTLSTLPDAVSATQTGVAVLKTGTVAKTGTASVIFFEAGAIAANVETGNYVYVDATKFSTSMVDGKNYQIYTGYKADGSTVELTGKTTLPTVAGLYNPDTDGKINAAAKVAASASVIDATTNKLVDAGDMVGVNGTFYYLTDATQVVYVDDDLNSLDDNQAWLILNEKDATKVDTIFVIAD